MIISISIVITLPGTEKIETKKWQLNSANNQEGYSRYDRLVSRYN